MRRGAPDRPGRGGAQTTKALALWRGPPLADLVDQGWLRPEIARLEELRLVALEERIDADLAAGRHADLVGELEVLNADHPLRERLRGQLMLALYRSARQAEALNAYRVAQRELTEQLELEPSVQLKRLERAILLQDRELDLPWSTGNGARQTRVSGTHVRDESRPEPRRPEPRRHAPRRRLVVLAAAALAACAAAVIALGGDRDPPPAPPAGSGLAAIDPERGRVSAFTEATTAPSNLAVGEGAVWVLDSEAETVAGSIPRRRP